MAKKRSSRDPTANKSMKCDWLSMCLETHELLAWCRCWLLRNKQDNGVEWDGKGLNHGRSWKAQRGELCAYTLPNPQDSCTLDFLPSRLAMSPFAKFHAWTQAPILLPPRKGPEHSLICPTSRWPVSQWAGSWNRSLAHLLSLANMATPNTL